MQALLLVDADMHRREKPLLDRLLVGLLDEGVRPTLAAPAAALRVDASQPEPASAARSSGGGENETGFVRLVEIEPHLPGPGERGEAASIVERAKVDEKDAGVVHAWGEGVWRLAMRCAARLGWPCVVEAWRVCPPSQLRAAKRFWRRLAQRSPLCFAASDERLAEALTRGLGREEGVMVQTSLWGSHAASTPLLRRSASPPLLCCALATSGRDVEALVAAVEGFTAVARDDDGAMLFLDEEATSRSRAAWRRAKALQALDKVTMLPDAEANRLWTLRCPFVLAPDRLGERRSALLDALGQGAVTLCSDEPCPPRWFQADTTAVVVPEATPQAWAATLERLWRQPAQAAAISEGAAAFVQQERSVWRHVQATLAVYAEAARHAEASSP
ncbi:MAG: glycosyltransferase family 1 protein [Planctomycetota bacterium]|nr:MAG: glycosyltransferase family 1 protein [Planctomycetota bacterium]